MKKYGGGYLAITILTAILAYLAMPAENQNTGEVIGYVFGGCVFVPFCPFLFAWLGKTDTPLRRFILFIAVWFILVALIAIGIVTTV